VLVGFTLILSLVVYFTLYRRAGAVRSVKKLGYGHWGPFLAGILILGIALVSPINRMSDDVLWAHMLQHVLVSDIAPGLLLLGLRAPILPLGLPPGALRMFARRGSAGRYFAFLRNPWFVLPFWAICQWVWAVPSIFEAAANNTALHTFEHATLFYSGLFLWWIIVDPLPSERRRPRVGRLALLGVSRVATATICLPLTFLGHHFYPGYAESARVLGNSPMQDQQLAGASMCFLEFLVFGIAFMIVFIDILGRDQRITAVSERAKAQEVNA
jgi:putative membrane protein